MLGHILLALILTSGPAVSHSQALVQQAQEDLKLGRYEEARVKLQESLKTVPQSPAGWFYLGVACSHLNDPDSAAQAFNHAIALAPEEAPPHFELGNLFVREKQWEKAVPELGRAVQLAPQSSKYTLALADALIGWRHYQTAISLLTAVRDRFGSLDEFQYKLALAYFYARQFEGAVPPLEHLASKNPDSDRVQFLLGNSYLGLGDLKRAEPALRRAIELNPRAAPYYISLAHVRTQVEPDNFTEPIHLLEKALQLDPSDTSSKIQLALCYEKDHQLGKAQELMEEVTRREPQLVLAHIILARVYYHENKKIEGDQEKAIVSRLQTLEEKEQPGRGTSTATREP